MPGERRGSRRNGNVPMHPCRAQAAPAPVCGRSQLEGKECWDCIPLLQNEVVGPISREFPLRQHFWGQRRNPVAISGLELAKIVASLRKRSGHA